MSPSDGLVAAAVGGDGRAFDDLAARHRRELHVHCYRMLASFDEAEDAVQEAMLRAWRSLGRFEGTHFRAWLYRIATNVCLDALRKRKRSGAATSGADVPWLQPYPDVLLDEVSTEDDAPDELAIERETIEIAFVVALQALPPRQRAALVARDVLGWSAAETGELLDTSVAAANSALQRARATMADRLPARRASWSRTHADADSLELLARFIDAHERGDAEAALAAAATDIRITMPPAPFAFEGIEALRPLLDRAFGEQRDGDWRLLPTAANRQPAAASYLRRPGDSTFRAFKLDVLRVVDGRIAEITTFGHSRFPALGLPATLDR